MNSDREIEHMRFLRLWFFMAFFFFVAMSFVGCGRSELPNSIPPQGTGDPGVLEMNSTSVDLGKLVRGETPEGMFTFRNVSSSPVQLSLGEPNCECLSVTLDPQSAILTPGEEGRLRLKLSTANRMNAGAMEGAIYLSVVGSKESYRLQVSGYLEGLVVPASYSLRPVNFQTADIPPLRFTMVTREEDTPVEIDSIGAYERGQAKTPIPALQFALDRIERHTPSPASAGKDYFERMIEVPVSTSEVKAPIGGDIVITYRLRGEEQKSSIALYLLSK